MRVPAQSTETWHRKRSAEHGESSNVGTHWMKAACRPLQTALSALVLPAMLGACQPDVEAATPQARPVRTVTTEKREAGVPVTLTGRIEAEDEVALAFRISGRLLENDRKLG